jgi:hypothetical protein
MNYLRLNFRKVPRFLFHMAGKQPVTEKEQVEGSNNTFNTIAEGERFQLSRQDASVANSRKSPLGRYFNPKTYKFSFIGLMNCC